jgi:hypothetical protein
LKKQNIDLTPEGFVFLRDQESLSSVELKIIDEIRQWITGTLEERENNYQNKESIPSANWNLDQPFYDKFRMLLSGRNIPLLRIYASHFTGYPLFALGDLSKNSSPKESIEEQDNFFRKFENRPDNSIQTYVKLIQNLPDYLHISPPQKFGEVGWRWNGRIINHDTCVYLEAYRCFIKWVYLINQIFQVFHR